MDDGRTPLDAEAASQAGMKEVTAHRMPNGELRFSLKAEDGSGYIATIAGPEGAWQNSHVHRLTREFYAVQSGTVGFAWIDERDKAKLQFYHRGEHFVTSPGVPHNIFMFPGTRVHTVKFGQCRTNDWTASPELDALTRDIITIATMNRLQQSNTPVHQLG